MIGCGHSCHQTMEIAETTEIEELDIIINPFTSETMILTRQTSRSLKTGHLPRAPTTHMRLRQDESSAAFPLQGFTACI